MTLPPFLCRLFTGHRWELRQSVLDRIAAIHFDDSSLNRWQEVCRRCGETRPVSNQSASRPASQRIKETH